MDKGWPSPRAIWTMLRLVQVIYTTLGYVFAILLLPDEHLFKPFLKLIGKNVFHRYKTDSEGHISHLFVAHPRSLEIFRNHHDLILLDCTYNSNRFKMPLLNMVGVTGMSTTIQVALVLMKTEKEADYVWALTILREALGEDFASIRPLL